MTTKKLERSQKAFLKAMKKKFSEDQTPEVNNQISLANPHPTLIPYRREA